MRRLSKLFCVASVAAMLVAVFVALPSTARAQVDSVSKKAPPNQTRGRLGAINISRRDFLRNRAQRLRNAGVDRVLVRRLLRVSNTYLVSLERLCELLRDSPVGSNLNQLWLDSRQFLIQFCQPEMPVYLNPVASQQLAEVGSSVFFEVDVSEVPGSGFEYCWDFGDGNTSSLASPTVTFDSAGVFEISLQVKDQDSNMLAAGTASLIVMDQANPIGLLGQPLPPLLGDMDQNGSLELRDGQLLRQHLAGLNPIVDRATFEVADLDSDGTISEFDSELLSQSILANVQTVSRIEPSLGSPGKVVTIFSDELNTIGGTVEVQVGTDVLEPARALLGQVSFYVPLDSPVGELNVSLLIDGVEMETFDFEVLPSATISVDDYRERLEAGFGHSQLIRSEYLTSLQQFEASGLAGELGLSSDNLDVLIAMLTTAFEEMNRLDAETLTSFDSQPDFIKEAAVKIAIANIGLDEFNDFSRGLGTVIPQTVSASGLDVLCGASTLAAGLDSAATIGGWGCSALAAAFAICVAIPFDGPVCDFLAGGAAVVTCATYLAYLELANAVVDLVPRAGSTLQLDASSTSVMPGESTDIVVAIDLEGITELCDIASGQATSAIDSFLASRITKAVLKRSPLKQIIAFARTISREVAMTFEDRVNSVVGSIIGASGVSEYLKEVATELCGSLIGNGLSLQIDPSTVMTSLNPDTGSIFASGDVLVFTCPDDVSQLPQDGQIKVMAVLTSCIGQPSGEVTISCGGTRDVTITMGDNGSLNDDIFEVRVDGVSVLTSSVPVRAISTTIPLTIGDHELQMIGRAAPDGIGTYYIEVVGGTLTNGPPQSGSNLTAGTVFTWTLVVEPE